MEGKNVETTPSLLRQMVERQSIQFGPTPGQTLSTGQGDSRMMA